MNDIDGSMHAQTEKLEYLKDKKISCVRIGKSFVLGVHFLSKKNFKVCRSAVNRHTTSA